MFTNGTYIRETVKLNMFYSEHLCIIPLSYFVKCWVSTVVKNSPLWHSSALTLHRSEETFSKDHWGQQGYHFDRLRLSSCLLVCKWSFYYLASLTGVKLTDICWAYEVFREVLIFTKHVFFLVCSCHFWNCFCFSVCLLFSGKTIWVVQNFQWNKKGNSAFSLLVICAQFL